jgi:hypothetical protein
VESDVELWNWTASVAKIVFREDCLIRRRRESDSACRLERSGDSSEGAFGQSKSMRQFAMLFGGQVVASQK